MLRLTNDLKYYLHNGPVDMRCGCNRLAAMVRNGIGENPISSTNVYVFMGKSRRIVKILRYDHGFWVMYEKRPVQGRFRKVVFRDTDQHYQISWSDLSFILNGVVIDSVSVSREMGEPHVVEQMGSDRTI